ncbi:MAG: hypothetical protein AAFX90_19435 [Pseudomonadota bacterium]
MILRLIKEHYSGVIAVLGFFGITTFSALQAKASELLEGYGPLVYWAVGLCFGLIFLAAYYGYMRIRREILHTKFIEKNLYAATVNPLVKEFRNEQIRLSDFLHPLDFYYDDKIFIDCELIGPAFLHAPGITAIRNEFRECFVLVLRNDAPKMGVVSLKNPRFENCRLANITFMMRQSEYDELPDEVKGLMPKITL